MGQVLIRSIPDQVLDAYRTRAQIAGKSLEQTLRELIVSGAPLSAEECQRISREMLAQQPSIVPSLTKEEMREGLE